MGERFFSFYRVVKVEPILFSMGTEKKIFILKLNKICFNEFFHFLLLQVDTQKQQIDIPTNHTPHF